MSQPASLGPIATDGRSVIAGPAMRYRRLRSTALCPGYQTEHAAGLDLGFAPEDGLSVTIDPGRIVVVPTGIVAAIPEGHEGQVRPRSGLASRFGITVINAPGTIDADYRGEIRIPLINHGDAPFVIEPGMRIAQMVIAPVTRVRLEEVEDVSELGSTERGAGGFGSTGVR